MKVGVRKFSWKKRLAARLSWKRFLRHNLGLKMPRGWGWLTNPKKAFYNRIYYRTTVSSDDVLKTALGVGRATKRRSRSTSPAKQLEKAAGNLLGDVTKMLK